MAEQTTHNMADVFVPGILLCQTHFAYRTTRNVIADAVERIAEEGFFCGVEIADVADPGDRRRIGEIVRARNLHLTQWMSMVLETEQLNLSSLDENLRAGSIARITQLLPFAAECGAESIAVISGPDPGPALRSEAVERLFSSLCELAEAIKIYHPMRLVLEPLDRDAHKNGLIGPTSEAVELARRLRRFYPDVGLCWDTAHAALSGEDVFESIALYHEFIVQMHLANAILDRSHSDFGDYHIPTGAPGFLTTEKIALIMGCAIKAKLFGEARPGMSVEIHTAEGDDPRATQVLCKRVLCDAWNMFVSGTPDMKATDTSGVRR